MESVVELAFQASSSQPQGLCVFHLPCCIISSLYIGSNLPHGWQESQEMLFSNMQLTSLALVSKVQFLSQAFITFQKSKLIIIIINRNKFSWLLYSYNFGIYLKFLSLFIFNFYPPIHLKYASIFLFSYLSPGFYSFSHGTLQLPARLSPSPYYGTKDNFRCDFLNLTFSPGS